MIKSLKQKLSLLLILPVALLLFLAGVSGFIYARNLLLDEWQKAAILKLERAAHHMDMRLGRPMEWIKMFHETAESRGGPTTQELILTRLKNLEGVTNVNLKWTDNHSEPAHMIMQTAHGWQRYDAISPCENFGSNAAALRCADQTKNSDLDFRFQG